MSADLLVEYAIDRIFLESSQVGTFFYEAFLSVVPKEVLFQPHNLILASCARRNLYRKYLFQIEDLVFVTKHISNAYHLNSYPSLPLFCKKILLQQQIFDPAFSTFDKKKIESLIHKFKCLMHYHPVKTSQLRLKFTNHIPKQNIFRCIVTITLANIQADVLYDTLHRLF